MTTLSHDNTDTVTLQPECYYRGFRDDSGTFTPVHWKILALKFAFVIIFEHLVFGVCKLIDIVVPDIPESLDIKVRSEWNHPTDFHNFKFCFRANLEQIFWIFSILTNISSLSAPLSNKKNESLVGVFWAPCTMFHILKRDTGFF